MTLYVYQQDKKILITHDGHVQLGIYFMSIKKFYSLAKEEYIKTYGPIEAKAFPARAAIPIKLLGLNENHIKCVYEKPGSLKIGTYIPGTRIPIVSDDEIVDISLKTGLINNAWHISTEIEGYLRNLGFNGQLINII